MTKISELTTKVTPIWADLVTWLDSADWDINTQNKNFTLDSIWTLAFSSKSTTDLPEGTNLYYTETRVTNNTTVVALWTDKADKTNVIEKDSVTAYTPTLWTHPANKDYVDNAWTNINWLVEEAGITDWDELIYYNGTDNVKIDFEDLKVAIGSDIHKTSIVSSTLDLSNVAWTFTIAHWLSLVPKKVTFNIDLAGNNFGTLVYWVDWVWNSSSWLDRSTTSNFSLSTAFLYREITNNWPLETITLNVTSIDSTNITITRTNVGTPSVWTNITCTVISES